MNWISTKEELPAKGRRVLVGMQPTQIGQLSQSEYVVKIIGSLMRKHGQ
ncbi:hypothetical protein [uncultured Megasphaera sp.]|nr:hypothetical protein [uncultured Megasphaera sp.]